MANVVFAFGPNGSYFYESATRWAMNGLPENLQRQFPGHNGQTQNLSINRTFTVALGADNSFYAAFYGSDAKVYEVTEGMPDHLLKWLRPTRGKPARDLRTVRISLGPENKSFFAWDKNGYWWWNLPASLKTAMDQMPRDKKGALFTEESPRIVALGVNGTYLMVRNNGGGRWDLKNEYPELERELAKLIATNTGKGGAFSGIHYANLDPHTGGHYAMLTTANEFVGDFEDASIEDAEKIVGSINDSSAGKSTPGAATTATTGSSRLEKLGIADSSLSILSSSVSLLSALGGGGSSGGAGS